MRKQRGGRICKSDFKQTVRWFICQCIGGDGQGTEASGEVRNPYGTVYEGSRECVKHLVKNGCRNLIYLDKTGRPCDRDIHLKGFLDQIKESGLVFEPEQRISGCEDIKELEERLQLMLEKNPSVDAIVARYDELAAVALSVARRIGRKVPDDLVVTGFDNDFISNYVSPALTTVEIRKEEVAKSAMEALLALIRNEKTDKNISITARLIIRDSTKQ